jgi:hypothetical protein
MRGLTLTVVVLFAGVSTDLLVSANSKASQIAKIEKEIALEKEIAGMKSKSRMHITMHSHRVRKSTEKPQSINSILNSQAANEEGSSFRQALAAYSDRKKRKPHRQHDGANRDGDGATKGDGDGDGDGSGHQSTFQCSDGQLSRIKSSYVSQGMDPLTAHIATGLYVQQHRSCERDASTLGAPAPTPDPSCSERMVIYGLMQKGTGKAVAKFIADGGWKAAVQAKGGTKADYCNPVPSMLPTTAPTSRPTSAPTVAATTAGLAMPFQQRAQGGSSGSNSQPGSPTGQQQHQQQIQMLPFIILGCTVMAYAWIGLTRCCRANAATSGESNSEYEPRQGSAMVGLYGNDEDDEERPSHYQSHRAQNQYV